MMLKYLLYINFHNLKSKNFHELEHEPLIFIEFTAQNLIHRKVVVCKMDIFNNLFSRHTLSDTFLTYPE